MVVTMHNFELDEFTNELNVEFSTKEDGDEFFREDKIDIGTLSMYLPPHFTEGVRWQLNLDNETLMDALNEYYIQDPLPDPQLL